MTLNTRLLRIALNTGLLLAFFTSLSVQPASALSALSSDVALPGFAEFSQTVQNGDTKTLRGVYVPELLATPVVQQPANNAGYVSSTDGVLTQFRMPSQFGNVGLLAHNMLAGKIFFELEVGQEVRLVYGDGRVETFIIERVLRYQAFQPNSPYSDFRDLSTDEILTADQVFRKAYTGDRHVTFQTCIAAEGVSTWGRIFVIATPKPAYAIVNRFDSR